MDRATAAARPRVRWRTIALPNEHGAWSLAAEPALLGFAWAPSWSGVCVAAAVVAAMLAQHPLSLALADVRRGKRFPRTLPAAALAGLFAALAGAALVFAAILGAPPRAFEALALAVPAALLQLAFDARNQGRRLGPELLGAVALGSGAAAVALAGGAAPVPAFALWFVAAARNVPSILFVRARLRRQRGQPAAVRLTHVTHGLALAGATGLSALGVLPWLAVGAFALLAVRAAVGLRRDAPTLAAPRVGVLETVVGLVAVLAVALGGRVGW